MPKLISVNVGLPREIEHEGKATRTAIFKEPVYGPVMLRALNLDGDGQADLKHHGGAHMAVYTYLYENYDYWKRKLRRDDLTYGQFGENLTVSGLTDEEIHIGDVFRVGEAVIQVTQPRIPCFKLGIRMGNARFPKLFLASGRYGFYSSVLQEGLVAAGDPVERLSADPERITVADVLRLLVLEPDNLAGAARALRLESLSPTWRNRFEERLEKRKT